MYLQNSKNNYMVKKTTKITSAAKQEQIPQELHQMADHWWVMLIQGISTVMIGWFLLKNPLATTLTIVVLLGLYWLIAGIVEVVASLFDIGNKGSKWGLQMVGGMVGIIVGIFVLNNPILTGIVTPIFLMYMVAFSFIINGVIHMAVGNQVRKQDNSGKFEWSWGSFFLGALYLLFGLSLLASPTLIAVATLVTLLAILSLVGGILMIVLSFNIRSLKEA